MGRDQEMRSLHGDGREDISEGVYTGIHSVRFTPSTMNPVAPLGSVCWRGVICGDDDSGLHRPEVSTASDPQGDAARAGKARPLTYGLAARYACLARPAIRYVKMSTQQTA